MCSTVCSNCDCLRLELVLRAPDRQPWSGGQERCKQGEEKGSATGLWGVKGEGRDHRRGGSGGEAGEVRKRTRGLEGREIKTGRLEGGWNTRQEDSGENKTGKRSRQQRPRRDGGAQVTKYAQDFIK